MIINEKREKGYLIFEFKPDTKIWKSAISEAKEDIFKETEIKGFRKGKAPKNLLEKSVSKDKIWNAAIRIILDTDKELAKKLYDLTSKENILRNPEPLIKKITDDEILIEFKSLLYPDIKLGDYKKLNLKREAFKVEQDEIDQEYNHFLKHIKDFKTEKNGKVMKHDVANIDFKGFIEDKEFLGGEAKGHDLEVGSGQFIPGFEEKLIGAEIGKKIDVNVSFPKDYSSSPDLAGKPVKFEVLINWVKRELKQSEKQRKDKLKKFGFETLEDIKKEIKILLEKSKNEKNDYDFQKKVIAKLIADKNTKIEIPEELILDEINSRKMAFEQKLSQQGLSLKQYAENIKKTEKEVLNETIRPEAVSRLETTLIINHIAKKEKIEVSEKDIENGIKEQSEIQKIPIDKIRPLIKIDMLRTNILFDKVLRFLSE